MVSAAGELCVNSLAEGNVAFESGVGIETPASFLHKTNIHCIPKAGGTTGPEQTTRVTELNYSGFETGGGSTNGSVG